MRDALPSSSNGDFAFPEFSLSSSLIALEAYGKTSAAMREVSSHSSPLKYRHCWNEPWYPCHLPLLPRHPHSADPRRPSMASFCFCLFFLFLFLDGIAHHIRFGAENQDGTVKADTVQAIDDRLVIRQDTDGAFLQGELFLELRKRVVSIAVKNQDRSDLRQ